MKSIRSILAVLALSIAFSTAVAQEAKPKRDPAETLKKLDKDGDGKISAEEWKAIPSAKTDPAKNAESFKKLDKNGDGFLTPEELSAMSGGKGGGKGKK